MTTPPDATQQQGERCICGHQLGEPHRPCSEWAPSPSNRDLCVCGFTWDVHEVTPDSAQGGAFKALTSQKGYEKQHGGADASGAPVVFGTGGYIGRMSREEFDKVTNEHPLTTYMGEELGECREQNARLRTRVLSAECFDDGHDECSGRFDLGDRVTGSCACPCHRRSRLP